MNESSRGSTNLITREEYLLSPCSASSLPYWKAVSFAVPENVLVLRDDEFRKKEFPGFADEPFFKLIHDMEGLEKPALGGEYSLIVPDEKALSAHIRACYGGGPSAKELAEYRAHPAYDPGLWLAVADSSGIIAASGVAELDKSIGEGVIEWIQVSNEHRRRGLGEYLVRELLWRMNGRAKFVTVSGMADNPYDPLGLYLRCGFGGKVIWHVLTRRESK